MKVRIKLSSSAMAEKAWQDQVVNSIFELECVESVSTSRLESQSIVDVEVDESFEDDLFDLIEESGIEKIITEGSSDWEKDILNE